MHIVRLIAIFIIFNVVFDGLFCSVEYGLLELDATHVLSATVIEVYDHFCVCDVIDIFRSIRL